MFFDLSTPSMRKVDNSEEKIKKKWKKRRKKRLSFTVATNIITSQPLERWPTGMPTACASIIRDFFTDDLEYKEIPSKTQGKRSIPSPFSDFAYFHRYGRQYLTYLPWISLSNLFFLGKVWLQNTLPTDNLDICSKFYSFFGWISLYFSSYK